MPLLGKVGLPRPQWAVNNPQLSTAKCSAGTCARNEKRALDLAVSEAGTTAPMPAARSSNTLDNRSKYSALPVAFERRRSVPQICH